jgi:hypothetical protein
MLDCRQEAGPHSSQLEINESVIAVAGNAELDLLY